ncbi:MAG: TIGR03987 family protein [Pseudonocardia sp.]|nr:TIGR03987 family protein [Pseudonocardia sp.]
MLPIAIVLITLALVWYTAGVWAERRTRSLKWWHVGAFAAGLAFDIGGTYMMSQIAAAGEQQHTEGAAGILNTVMSVTGFIALILMAVHFTWAAVVMLRDRENERASFHRFSVGVWAIWLVPYFSGMTAAMIG